MDWVRGTVNMDDAKLIYLVACVLTALSSVGANSNCTTGLDTVSGLCFWREYTSRTFKEARLDCKTKGGTLGMLKTQALQTFVENGSLVDNNEMWIGGSDGLAEGTWRWTDTEVLTWTAWNSGQPNGGADQNCLVLSTRYHPWQDKACTDAYQYLCQGSPAEPCLDQQKCITSADWEVTLEQCLFNDTYEMYHGVTLEECKGLCLETVEVLCQSVSYLATATRCRVSTSKAGPGYPLVSCNSAASYQERVQAASTVCYTAMYDPGTWLAAQAGCNATGMQLAQITSPEEEAQVQTVLGESVAAWIGLTDAAAEGMFGWTDGTYPITWANWLTGRPADSATGARQDCAMRRATQDGGTWDHETCTATTLTHYLCQYLRTNACDEAPRIPKSNRLVDNTTVTVLYECEAGYVFRDGQAYHSVDCLCNSTDLYDVVTALGSCIAQTTTTSDITSAETTVTPSGIPISTGTTSATTKSATTTQELTTTIPSTTERVTSTVSTSTRSEKSTVDVTNSTVPPTTTDQTTTSTATVPLIVEELWSTDTSTTSTETVAASNLPSTTRPVGVHSGILRGAVTTSSERVAHTSQVGGITTIDTPSMITSNSGETSTERGDFNITTTSRSVQDLLGLVLRWDAWTAWMGCDVGCGVVWKRSRFKLCSQRDADCLFYLETNDARRIYYGVKIAACPVVPCPVAGGWSPWSEWSGCSVTCGSGTRRRARTCSQPAPSHGGVNCTGGSLQARECQSGVKCAELRLEYQMYTEADQRPSAQGIGAAEIILVTLALGVIVLGDFSKFKTDLGWVRRTGPRR